MYSNHVFWSNLPVIPSPEVLPLSSYHLLSHLHTLFLKTHGVPLICQNMHECTVIYCSMSSDLGFVSLKTSTLSDFTSRAIYKKVTKKLWEEQSHFVGENIFLWHDLSFQWIQNGKDWFLLRKRKHPTGVTHECRLYVSCLHMSSELDCFTFGLGIKQIPKGVRLYRRFFIQVFYTSVSRSTPDMFNN